MVLLSIAMSSTFVFADVAAAPIIAEVLAYLLAIPAIIIIAMVLIYKAIKNKRSSQEHLKEEEKNP